MPINFTCPHCNHQTLVNDQYAGQTGPCQSCGQPITVPLAAPNKLSSPAPSASAGSGAVLVVILVIAGVGVLGVIGVLTALLLPAVQASREAARRMSCTNNLKQIAIGLHNYHAVHNTFPPAYLADENGKPMHSWRVLILPYVEQQVLYDQYDFSKPWDSPENMGVVQTPLAIFMCPSNPNVAGANTHYMVVTGPGTMFQKDKGTRLAQIRDGTSNTIAVVEVTGQNVSWAQPQDIDGKQLNALIHGGNRGKASFHPGGMNAAHADGSVHFIANSIAPKMLASMCTIAGND